MTRFLILIVTLATLVSVGFSQKRDITREEFSESYSAALERSKDFPRTHESKQVSNVSTRIWKWVYAEGFNSRLKYGEKSDKGVISFEMITIAESTFCKIGDGEWKKTQRTCDVRVPWAIIQMSWMMESGAKSEFFVESIAENTRYTEIGRLPKRTLPSGNQAQPRTYESVFVTDGKGRMVRQEYTGYETGTKKGPPTWIDTFTYDQKNLKIEAPIK